MVKPPVIHYQQDFTLENFPLSRAEAEIQKWLDGGFGTIYILKNEKAIKVSLNRTKRGHLAIDSNKAKKIIVLFSSFD